MNKNNCVLREHHGTPRWSLLRRRVWLVLGISIPLLGLGCTHDHKIDLHPELFVHTSNLGEGQRLLVRVKDTRSQKAISKKESGFQVESGRALNTVNIYASSDVMDTVSDKIMEGFQRLGFHPVRHGNRPGRKIIVELFRLQLNYQIGEAGLKVPEIHAQMETVLRVRATRGSQSFKNIYRSRMIKSHRMLTGKFTNERLVNNSLSMALQKMFEDPKLLQFLAVNPP